MYGKYRTPVPWAGEDRDVWPPRPVTGLQRALAGELRFDASLRHRKSVKLDFRAASPLWHLTDHITDKQEDETTQVHPSVQWAVAQDLNLSIMYVSPFLSCDVCSTVTWVHELVLHPRLHLDRDVQVAGSHPDVAEELPREQFPVLQLPACTGCGRTDAYHVGAADFGEAMWQRRKGLWRLYRRQMRAAMRLQAAFRGMMDRKWARALRRAKQQHADMLYGCATCVQAWYRGTLGRRAAQTERLLQIIQNTHPSIRHRATHMRSRKKVFWYKTEPELSLLYRNYLLLVERSGNQPPRFLVESNIKEIARRVRERENQLATRIQATFRGMVGRKSIKIYKQELIRVREIRAASVYSMQRTFRGWFDRRVAARVRKKVQETKLLRRYKKEREGERRADEHENRALRLLKRYGDARQEEKTARFVGKASFGARHTWGCRIAAFAKSAYGSDHLDRAVDSFVDLACGRIARTRQQRADLEARAEFVMQKSLAHPGYEHYYRQEMGRLWKYSKPSGGGGVGGGGAGAAGGAGATRKQKLATLLRDHNVRAKQKLEQQRAQEEQRERERREKERKEKKLSPIPGGRRIPGAGRSARRSPGGRSPGGRSPGSAAGATPSGGIGNRRTKLTKRQQAEQKKLASMSTLSIFAAPVVLPAMGEESEGTG